MRKKILCVLEKPYTYDKKRVGEIWKIASEEEINLENYSNKILRKTFPKSDFYFFTTNVDRTLGDSAKSKSNEVNVDVLKLMKEYRINTVAFCGRKAQNYYNKIQNKIIGDVILMPHPRSITIKKREAVTKFARKNKRFVSFW